MEIQERLKLAQEAGPRYIEIASMFEAAITTDESKLQQFRNHESASVRFAAFVNPLTVPVQSDIDTDPLIKYAAIHNPSTSTEILDHIGLNKTAVNPVIPEVIHTHKNASKEFQVFRAITDFGNLDDEYESECEAYFFEAIFEGYGDVRHDVDAVTLEGLFYLYLLGLIQAPGATDGEFWPLFEEGKHESKNLSQVLSAFARIPAFPAALYESCETAQRARVIAAEFMEELDIYED